MCLAAALLWLGEAAALTSQKITGRVTRPLLKKQARRKHTFDSNSTDNKSKNKSVGLQRSKKLLRSKRNHQKKKQPAQRERASAKPRDRGGGNTQSRKGPSEPTANKLTTGLKTGGSERFRTRPRAWPAGTRKGLGGTARGSAAPLAGDRQVKTTATRHLSPVRTAAAGKMNTERGRGCGAGEAPCRRRDCTPVRALRA